MKGSRYTEEQIAFALRQAESGIPAAEVCRKMGGSENALYAWKKEFDGLHPAHPRKRQRISPLCCSAAGFRRRALTAFSSSSDMVVLGLMRRLQRRFASIRNAELFNVFFLPLVFWSIWRDAEDQTFVARTASMALVGFLLIQGSVYWHLKLCSLQTHTPIANRHLLVFYQLKRVNVVALCLTALGIILAGLSGAVTPQDAWWGLSLTFFAWLEFVNYYFVQLMHDTRRDLAYLRRWKRLRLAPLATDLRQAHLIR